MPRHHLDVDTPCRHVMIAIHVRAMFERASILSGDTTHAARCISPRPYTIRWDLCM